MRIGIIDLLLDAPPAGWADRLYAARITKQFASIMPQAISVWCRELGHEVFYATYYGQADPRHLLPDELDVVFVASYTQASALAYALAKLFRKEHTLTVVGGPHAKCFPVDCLRFFDLVVEDCDKTLIADILTSQFDPPAIVTSGRALKEIPSVEDRLPEILTSTFYGGRPRITTVVPMLASVGCPYSCDFCVDWNNTYAAMPSDRLEADIRFVADRWPGVLVAYHDPNFAVRFDTVMNTIESLPKGRRNPYAMESSLAILKGSRLARLQSTNCAYVAPGVESWTNYSNKAGAGARLGRDKLDLVVAHFKELARFVPALQANFIIGGDEDEGAEPIELTKEFIRRLPSVWPALNIPTPFGGTPMFDKLLTEGRLLRAMPFAFYYNPYLTVMPKNYHPIEYYDHLIEVHALTASAGMLARRMSVRQRASVKALHAIRTFGVRSGLANYRRIRDMLATDAQFRAFHEGRSDTLPAYYRWRFKQRFGRYAELLSPRDLRPMLGSGRAALVSPT